MGAAYKKPEKSKPSITRRASSTYDDGRAYDESATITTEQGYCPAARCAKITYVVATRNL